MSEQCLSNNNGQLRLNRAIAACGICSRRKADQLILQGHVCVNGLKETNPATRVSAADKLSVHGKEINPSRGPVYVMLNKPVQTICSVHDPQHRPTVMDLLPDDLLRQRIYPVGRLDYFSEGLLLLTNDGELAQKLAHPRHQHAKVYEVLVRGDVSNAQLDAMRSGMTLEDGTQLLPVDVNIRKMSGRALLTLTLRQGINRQIRRMCCQLGLVILKLKRVSQGPLRLGSLAPGAWRKLEMNEIAALRALP